MAEPKQPTVPRPKRAYLQDFVSRAWRWHRMWAGQYVRVRENVSANRVLSADIIYRVLATDPYANALTLCPDGGKSCQVIFNVPAWQVVRT